MKFFCGNLICGDILWQLYLWQLNLDNSCSVQDLIFDKKNAGSNFEPAFLCKIALITFQPELWPRCLCYTYRLLAFQLLR